MSLRRAAGNKKSLIPPYTTAVVTPSLTGHGQRHPRSSWILSGVAVLFVAGIFISSLSPREEDNEQFNVRSSSNGEHPHRIPDFEPVHKECTPSIRMPPGGLSPFPSPHSSQYPFLSQVPSGLPLRPCEVCKATVSLPRVIWPRMSPFWVCRTVSRSPLQATGSVTSPRVAT